MPSLAPHGDRLGTFRRVLGLTQLELAVRSGVSERTIRNAERGRPIKRDFLEYIAAGLGVSMDDVIHVSTELSSHLRWQRNLETVMATMRRIFSERPWMDTLDFAQQDITCRVQGLIPCLAQEERLFGEFQGAANFQQFLTSVRNLWRKYGAVDYYLEKPVGGGESVVIRCGHEVPLPSGEFTWLRSVFVCEFEMQRLKRIDIYIVPDLNKLSAIRSPSRQHQAC
jgi:transcriptional regulator with XRE-family HTH domain